jgi:hypothetical protein
VKYVAPVELRNPGTPRRTDPDGDGTDEIEIVDLVGGGHDLLPMRSGRRLGVLIGLAVALVGYGFAGQFSGSPTPGPVHSTDAADRSVAAAPTDPLSALGPDRSRSEDDQPLIVTAPTNGSTLSGEIEVTGGVVLVDAIARRPLGAVRASVSIGGAVLGCRNVSVERAGPLEVRIPVFPPGFDAPVVLSMTFAPFAGRPGFALARDLRLDIPSVAGFWDAAPTATVVQTGRVQMLIHGYGPRSARTVDIAIQDALGAVVANTSVPITDDLDCPGSTGGRIFGLGSFVARLWLPAGTTGSRTLSGRWRDDATGQELHFETSLGSIERPAERQQGGR